MANDVRIKEAIKAFTDISVLGPNSLREAGKVLVNAYLSMEAERDSAIKLGQAIGNAMDDLESELDEIKRGAIAYDIGAIAHPHPEAREDNILAIVSQLERAQRLLLKGCTALGVGIISDIIDTISRLAAPKSDGQGVSFNIAHGNCGSCSDLHKCHPLDDWCEGYKPIASKPNRQDEHSCAACRYNDGGTGDDALCPECLDRDYLYRNWSPKPAATEPGDCSGECSVCGNNPENK